MSIFPFLHVFAAIAYLYLAVYIYIKNPRALLNRLCAAFLLCFAVWSFHMAFIHNPYVSKNTARIASDISSLGWCSFSSFFLWFMLAFSGKKKILKKKWFYILLLGIPLLFIYKQWTNFLITDFSMQYYGWRLIWSRTIWPYLFFVYYISFMTVGLYINIDFMRKAPNAVLKKQAVIIFVTIMIVFILGTVTDAILPKTNIHIIPNIADIIILIWAVGVVYAIARYKFLTITPTTAADNIISTMYDCLILLNTEGEIITVNKASSDLLGYKEVELKGKPVSFLFRKEDLKNGLFKEIVSEGSLKNKNLILKTREGKEIPTIFSVSILRDEAGNAAGIVCVARDISERKKLEEEIFKRKKLESIGIFAGGIAHDFSNLFAIIVGNLALAQEAVLPGETSYKLLVDAGKVSLKAADLARKFITFSPGGWLKKENVNLSEMLKNTRERQLAKMNVNIMYDIDIPGDLMPIYGDVVQLDQVMANLFLNAAEAIEALPGREGGKISVRAENISVGDIKDEKKTGAMVKAGLYVKVSIEDNGIGIPPGNIDNVFDPYFTTKDKTGEKGLGMGLTLCYSIIKKHDGHITVESPKGKGTVVTLYLPARR